MCLGRQKRGSAVCSNNTVVPAGLLERAVLEALLGGVLSDVGIEAVVRQLRTQLQARLSAAHRPEAARRRQVATLDRQIDRLTMAIAAGNPPAALVEALHEREATRATLLHVPVVTGVRSATAAIDRALATARRILEQWQRDIAAKPEQLRALLASMVVSPIVLTAGAGTGPNRAITFSGEAHLVGLFNGQVDRSLLSWRPHRDSWLVVAVAGGIGARHG
jgi:hypothetical protein